MSDDTKHHGKGAKKHARTPDFEGEDFDDEEFDDDFGDEEFDDEHLFDEAEFEAEGWSIPRDPEAVARLLKSLEGLVPDILRRSSQEGGREADEEGESLRSRLSDRKLPREAVSFILGQVDTTKREFLRILSREIRLFLENMDLGGELAKILTSLSFEVRMEVRFIPNDQAFRPSAKGRMRIKRTGKKNDDADDEPDDDVDSDEQGEGDADEEPNEESKPRRWSLRRRGHEEEQEDED